MQKPLATFAANDSVAPTNSPTSPRRDSVLASPAPGITNWPTTWRVERACDLQLQLDGRFLIDGVLPSGLSQIFGEPNSGKTALALTLALHLATGTRTFGREVDKAPVLYVAAENPSSIINRLIAATARLNIDRQALDNFYVLDAPLNVMDAEHLRLLQSFIVARRLEGCALFLDTQAMVTPGADENSNMEMGRLVAAALQLRKNVNASTILIHHTTKGTETPRGASSVYGGLDAALLVKPGYFTVKKARDFQKDGSQFPFDIVKQEIGPDRRGRPVTAGVAVLGTSTRPSASANGQSTTPKQTQRTIALDELERLAAAKSGDASVSEWEAACRASFGTEKDESFERTFRKIKRRLEMEGAIKIDDGRVSLQRDRPLAFESLDLTGVKPAVFIE